MPKGSNSGGNHSSSNKSGPQTSSTSSDGRERNMPASGSKETHSRTEKGQQSSGSGGKRH